MKILLRNPKDWEIDDAGTFHATRHALTTREREIIKLLSQGKTIREVALKLNIALKTTETHRANIMRKLNIESATELVSYAVRNRTVEP